MTDQEVLKKYRDIEIAGKTWRQVVTEIGYAFLDGVEPEDMRLLAGTLASPVVQNMDIAGEWCEVSVDRFGPGDRLYGILVV